MSARSNWQHLIRCCCFKVAMAELERNRNPFRHSRSCSSSPNLTSYFDKKLEREYDATGATAATRQTVIALHAYEDMACRHIMLVSSPNDAATTLDRVAYADIARA